MKFDTPATTNPIDQLKIIGHSTSRIDGPLKVTGIPNFAPEIIRRVRLSDPMKSKQLGKALSDLAEEGVAQVFRLERTRTLKEKIEVEVVFGHLSLRPGENLAERMAPASSLAERSGGSAVGLLPYCR